MHNRQKYTIFETKWGWFGLAASENGVLKTQLPAATRQQNECKILENLPGAYYEKGLLSSLQKQIKAYYEGTYVDFSLGIQIDLERFCDFARVILTAARDIKLGQTMAYSELAASAGRPGAARAAGSIMAKNPMPLIIPCHRVIRSDGSLGGFSAGGIKTKHNMLDLERRICKSA